MSAALREGARVLVVRTGALGDVVNALAFAAAVKRARPDVALGWVAHELAYPLLDGHPLVERAHLWRRGSGLAGFRALARELRDARYDVAVDLQRILKSALVARAARAPRTIGYDRGRSKELCWLLHTERISGGPRAAPMPRQFLEFAVHLGLLEADAPAFEALERPLPVRPAAAARADELLAGFLWPIAVNAGASKQEKRWPPERVAALARALAEEDRAVVVIGSPQDRETMGAALGELGDARDLVGRTDVPTLVEVLRRSCLYVGADSGPMHVAAALGTPCVALFGPGDPARTGPAGPTRDGRAHRVLRAPSRRVADIAVDEVLTAALE